MNDLEALLEFENPEPATLAAGADVYDMSARYDVEFFTPARARQPVDCTFDFVEIEAIILPAIDLFDALMKSVEEDISSALMSSHYPRDRDIVKAEKELTRAHDKLLGVRAILLNLERYKIPGIFEKVAEFLSAASLPIDPQTTSRIAAARVGYVAQCNKAILGIYERIIGDGRMVDVEKAVIDGAIYALETEQFDECRAFLDRIPDVEIACLMVGQLDMIRHDVDIMRRTPRELPALIAHLKTLARPIPLPEETKE